MPLNFVGGANNVIPDREPDLKKMLDFIWASKTLHLAVSE